MGTELQTLNERIAERIGKDLVDLIPADQWQQLVDDEIKKFKLTVAPKIIQDLLAERYIEQAKGILDKFCTSTDWDAAIQENIYTDLEKFIAKSSGVIVAGMLTPSMQQVLYNLRQQLGY